MRQAHGSTRFDANRGLKGGTHKCRQRPRWLLPLLVACALGAATTVEAQTSYIYDSNSRLIGVLNASGNTTRYVYDDIGNLVRTDSLPSSQFALLGFSPGHGAPGIPVTIWGQGFSTTAGADTVSFNGTTATVASATANQLQVTVPAGAATGPISVTVGGATVPSANAFTVDDTGIAPTLTSVSPTIGAAGTVVTLTGTHLDPVAGGTSVMLNGVPVIPITITDGNIQFATPTTFGSGRFLVTTPYGQATAGSDFTTIEPDVTGYTVNAGRIVINGSHVTVKTTSSQNVAELLLDASTGDWLTLQGSGLPNSGTVLVEGYDPRGVLISPNSDLNSTTPSTHFLQIPMTGTYTLVVLPNQAANFSIWMERDAQITLNTPYAFATTITGQSKRVIFDAAPGQSLGVGVSNPSVSSSGSEIVGTILDINGQQMANTNCLPGGSPPTCAINLPAFAVNQSIATLPAPGVRQLTLTSDSTAKATVTVTPDASQTLTANTPVTLQLGTVGQNGDQTFSGVTGQFWSVNVTAVATTPSGNSVDFTLYDPSGAQVYTNEISSSQVLNFPQLAMTGTYTLYVTPYQGVTANISDTLLSNSTAAATVNGSPASVNSSLAGQNAYVTFQAVQGQSYTVSGVCNSSDGFTNITIIDPSGNTVGSGGYCGASNQSAPVSSATASGTYTITLQDSAPFSASVTVTQP